jgi:hypothetical protein
MTLVKAVSGPFLLRAIAHGTSAWHLSAMDEFDIKDLIKIDTGWLVGKRRSRTTWQHNSLSAKGICEHFYDVLNMC